MTAPAPERPLRQELGVPGLRIWGGVLQEEFLVKLRGDQHLRVFKEMQADAIVGASLLAIRDLIMQVQFGFEPEDRSAEAIEDARFREDRWRRMRDPWSQTLTEVLSFLPWGYSWHEKVLTRIPEGEWSGRIGWSRWPIRAQDTRLRWHLKPNGEVEAFEQSPPDRAGSILIPRARSLHFRHGAHKGNPEGQSLLRAAYKAWYLKTNLERIEAIGHERSAAGLPFAKVPSEILTDSQYADTLAEYKSLVTRMRMDDQAGLVIPSDTDDRGHPLYEIGLLSPTSGTESTDLNRTITRYDQRIAQTMLTDLILIGHEKVGSFKLSENKENMLTVALEAILTTILDEVNSEYGVGELVRLNNLATRPRMVYGSVGSLDLDKIGNFITKLTSAGMKFFPNRRLTRHLYDQARFPAPTDEELDTIEAEAEAAKDAMQEQLTQRGDGGVGDQNKEQELNAEREDAPEEDEE